MLKSLQVDYINAIPAKIISINSQIQAKDVSAVRESFHKFKGTGKTYGLPEVSELAEIIERLCIHQPSVALGAASQAVTIFEDIYKARKAQSSFSLNEDPRYKDIRNLLQK